MSTPVASRITTELDHFFRRLDRERITHWLIQFAAKQSTDVADGLGGRIRIGPGVRFEGSPSEMFWSFMHPILEAKIVDVCRRVEAETKEYSDANAILTFDLVGGALRGLVARTFRKMAEVDQLLRGKAFPKSVPRRNVDREIARHNEFIAAQIAALKIRPSTRNTQIGVPAADRVVTLDHNAPKFMQFTEAIVRVETELEGANDPDRIQRAAEVAAGKRLLDAPRVRIGALAATIGLALVYLGQTFIETALGKAADQAWAILADWLPEIALLIGL